MINNLLEQEDLSESTLRRRVAGFRRSNQVQIPKNAPNDPRQLVVGERYVGPRGIGVWNGERFIIE